ncbi:protein Niban-like isoform X2 [Gouania willdenowi]|uniref:protein Niban-like isoform X2 n=1 Tax=Gouania willdenowi TaxID=441366 RepID=UPI00105653AB|nr:protein Niban-like isoform X2 [Gouania willdenowi]
MGASSSGLLDEAKVSHIKGLADSSFQRFSAFYRQQYAAAYYGQVHKEVEPKKEGRSLILTQRPQYDPQTVLYQSSVKFSCWDEQGKKPRERYIVLRRNYNLEVLENIESFRNRCAAKLIIQPAGGSVFTTEEEFRVHLEKTCSGILNAREDSSSVVSPPDTFAVYLQLPHRGHSCFLFQQEKERHHFLSHLKTCIRHCNLDPWRSSSFESQAFARALRQYRQDKGRYESWEMQFGAEEQVLASQVMEEVLPWLQTQLHSRVKGKQMERIRLWQATVQATYTVVLEQLTAKLQSLRKECHQTASANQMLIRSNLDQIVTSHSYLEQKVKDCISKEAEEVCREFITPYMSSMTETLTDNISAAFVGMQDALHAHMDSVFSETLGGVEHTKQASSSLSSISLDQYYQQVEKVAAQLEDLEQRFGMSDVQRLIFFTHLELEQLQENALYTLEQFIKSSARLQPSQVPVKMKRAKERVLKQLDYDSRVVQRRLYQEALQDITLPFLTKTMDRRWRTDLQQFEQYIFSDYSSFILVENIYEDVLRNILNTEIEKVLQEAVSRKTISLLLDMSDLALSQYSLLGPSPPRSAPQSPAVHPRLSSSVVPIKNEELPHLMLLGNSEIAEQKVSTGAELKASPAQTSEQDTIPVSPVIVVTQEPDEQERSKDQSSGHQRSGDQSSGKISEEVVAEADSVKTETGTSTSEKDVTDDVLPADLISDPESSTLNPEFSTLNPESSILNSESNIFTESSTLNPEFSTLNPESSTLVPESSIPNPESSTLNSDSSIPYPESCTLNPESSTLIPESSTLNPESNTLIPNSSTLNSESGTLNPPDQKSIETEHDNCSMTDFSSSDQRSEVIPCTEPFSADTDRPLKVNLGTLSEVIRCIHEETPIVQQTTDRAVYLKGEIKKNWDAQNVKKQQAKEVSEKKEEEEEGLPAEGAITEQEDVKAHLQHEDEGAELKKNKREENEEAAKANRGHHTEEEKGNVKEGFKSSQPIESQPESVTELPLDNIALIRELITEVTVVETVISPCDVIHTNLTQTSASQPNVHH